MLEELLDMALKGDKEAYGQLVKMISPELYYIAKRQLSNEEDIQEVIQETFLKSYKNLHTLKNKAFFKTWIIRILFNECKNINFKNYKRFWTLKKVASEATISNTENLFDNIEHKMNLTRILAMLSKEETMIIILHYKYGYSMTDIAYILKKNTNTVRSKLLRAKQKIKKL